MALGRVLWKAIDGREFIIDTRKLGIDTVEQLQEHIAKLREENGYEQPDLLKNHTVSHFQPMNASAERIIRKHKAVIDTADLPDDLRKEMEETYQEALNRPDPKTLN